MNITPLGTHLLIKPLKAEDKLKADLVVPDTARRDRPEMGTIRASGPEAKLQPGTQVIFNKYATDEVDDEGNTLLLIEEKDVLATYNA